MKFILHPDHVRSKNDGDLHYIGAAQLARLYGVKMSECLIAGTPEEVHRSPTTEVVHLYPREDGSYPASGTTGARA